MSGNELVINLNEGGMLTKYISPIITGNCYLTYQTNYRYTLQIKIMDNFI